MAVGPRPQNQSTPSDVLAGLDRIDSSLESRLTQDGRLESGIGAGQRLDEVDFIQMTGLTTPARAPVSVPDQPQSRDVDTSKPLDFFEPGVADVDSSEMNDAILVASGPDQDIVSHMEDPEKVAPIRDFMADFTRASAATSNQPDDAPENPPIDLTKELEALVDTARPAAVDSPSSADLDASLREMLRHIEAERATSKATAGPTPSSELSDDEADKLLKALHEQPRVPDEFNSPKVHSDVSYGTPHPEGEGNAYHLDLEPGPDLLAPQASTTGTDMVEDEDPSAAIYNRPDPHAGRRRHQNPRRRLTRRLLSWGIRLLLLVAIVVAGFQAYRYFRQRMITPEGRYAEAQSHFARHDYLLASNEMLAFSAKFPSHPARPEAQFMGALALQLAAPTSPDGPHDMLVQARAHFEQFILDNPNHEKVARAKNIVGAIHYDLGEYEKCIDLLRDPNLRIADPVSALPAMRTLARAYGKIGDLDAARSAYLQAVSMSTNYTTDMDYEELGNLYKQEADAAKDAETKKKFQELALEQWSNAIKVRGVSPTHEKQLMFMRDQLQAELSGMLPPAPKVESESVDEATETEVVGEHPVEESAASHEEVSPAEPVETAPITGALPHESATHEAVPADAVAPPVSDVLHETAPATCSVTDSASTAEHTVTDAHAQSTSQPTQSTPAASAESSAAHGVSAPMPSASQPNEAPTIEPPAPESNTPPPASKPVTAKSKSKASVQRKPAAAAPEEKSVEPAEPASTNQESEPAKAAKPKIKDTAGAGDFAEKNGSPKATTPEDYLFPDEEPELPYSPEAESAHSTGEPAHSTK